MTGLYLYFIMCGDEVSPWLSLKFWFRSSILTSLFASHLINKSSKLMIISILNVFWQYLDFEQQPT